MMLKKFSRFGFFLVLIFFVALTACGNSNGKSEGKDAKATSVSSKGAKGTTPAYNFKLELLDGRQVTLSDYKGKALIIDVWDTWCPPCKAEIPHFIELYNEYNSKGLEILGVAGARYGRAAVEKFIKDYGMNYHNAILNEDFYRGFGPINSIPTTFVIDTEGNIYKKYIGYNEKSVFEADVKAVLGL